MATKIKGFNIETDAINKIEDRIQGRIATPGNVKVRKAITDLVDSNYVTARAGPSTDSAAVINIIDSDYVRGRSGLLSQNALIVPSFDSAGAAALTGTDGMLIFNTTQQKLTYFDSSNTFKSINSNTPPTFDTAAGSLGTIYDRSRGVDTFTVAASDVNGDNLTFSVIAGSLPSGMSLNSSTGVISGTPAAVGTDTTTSFTLQVSDGQGGTAVRSFSFLRKAPIVVNYTTTDTVHTWTKPSTDVKRVYAVMWGGGGGGGNPSGQGGGGGGYTYGTMNVESVSTLNVVVGEYGEGENNYFGTGNGNGCGGGLSGIFTLFNSDRVATYGRSILIAGGGGGGGNNGGYPGTGGGNTGVSGTGGQGGPGGTQSAGGSTASSGGSCTSNCVGQQLRGANGCGGSEFDGGGSFPSMYWGGVWSAGAGGNGCNAGGGGGGYWGGGGGGGSPNGGQGGGGSGYIGGHSSVAVSGASTSSNGNSRNPAGTGDTDYSGNVGKGASGAELDGHTGKVVLRY
ncbi:MAG: hypothetical protein CMQ68_05690 [Gammaproteobacteria bacterium]|nr:hypothetical protein [Gammaproteobacteria bacterium]|tara:strand:+ start:1816 stop:3345 length:1530 start_codon:yes stop_codon:yes gene_type:complete